MEQESKEGRRRMSNESSNDSRVRFTLKLSDIHTIIEFFCFVMLRVALVKSRCSCVRRY